MAKAKATEKIGAYSLLSTTTRTIFISDSSAKTLEGYAPGTTKSEVMESLEKAAKITKGGISRKKR